MGTVYYYNRLQRILNISHIISIFFYKGSKDHDYSGESHDFWEFIFIEKGEMLITAGEKKYILKAGELAFHRPGEFHAVAAHGGTTPNFIVCSFISDSPCMHYFEHKILALNGFEKDNLYQAVAYAKKVFTYLVEIEPGVSGMKRLEDAPEGTDQMVQNHLELMLLNLYQRSDSEKIEKRAESLAKIIREKKLTESIVKYLEQHLCEQLALDKIANDLGYCISQIQKLFKAEMGQSIIDYFIDLKIEEAKRLIKEANYNFTQIAYILGYNNVNYFSRLFKQRTGITPSEYAKIIKNFHFNE